MTPDQQEQYNSLMALAESYRHEAESHENMAEEARENWETCLEEAEGFREKCEDEDKS